VPMGVYTSRVPPLHPKRVIPAFTLAAKAAWHGEVSVYPDSDDNNWVIDIKPKRDHVGSIDVVSRLRLYLYFTEDPAEAMNIGTTYATDDGVSPMLAWSIHTNAMEALVGDSEYLDGDEALILWDRLVSVLPPSTTDDL